MCIYINAETIIECSLHSRLSNSAVGITPYCYLGAQKSAEMMRNARTAAHIATVLIISRCQNKRSSTISYRPVSINDRLHMHRPQPCPCIRRDEPLSCLSLPCADGYSSFTIHHSHVIKNVCIRHLHHPLVAYTTA